MAEDHNPFGSSAYDEAPPEEDDVYAPTQGVPDSKPPPPRPPPPRMEQPTEMYGDEAGALATQVAVGGAQTAYDETAADYDKAKQDTSGEHEAPEPPAFCEKLLMWFPVRYLAALGGLFMFGFPILDFAINSKGFEFAHNLLLIFLMLCGIIIFFIELPAFVGTRWMQLKVFYWAKILSRTWGRGWFYVLVSLIALSTFEATDNTTATGFAGIYMVVICLCTFIVARTSCSKYNRMYDYIAMGKEGEERDALFTAKFEELDPGNSGTIGSTEIVKLGKESGRVLANAEVHAIQSFLDESCNGRVKKDDFFDIFTTHNPSTSQRFL